MNSACFSTEIQMINEKDVAAIVGASECPPPTSPYVYLVSIFKYAVGENETILSAAFVNAMVSQQYIISKKHHCGNGQITE